MKEFFKKIWNEEGAHLNSIDFIILGILIVIYSMLAFFQLGTSNSPQTYFYVVSDNNQIDIMLEGDATDVLKIRHFAGPEVGSYQVLYSEDGENYIPLDNPLEQKSVFAWDDYDTDVKLKYLRLIGQTDGSQIGEIQLYDRYGYKLNLVAMNDTSESVVDELDTVPDQISYQNSTYFDEIYFARTAYEYANDMPAYEWVHPPLGKVIQMIPIALMGMSPFSYRLMGVLAGILLIPVIYILAKNMFKKRKYAILAGALMAFDTFHLAQSRLGTIDTFLVLFILLSFLFMYQYISLTKEDSLFKRLRKLFFSGLFIGCAIATKWTGLFGGLALAIIFFADLIYKNCGKGKRWTVDTTVIVLCCFVFFILLPLVIYIGIYFMYPYLSVAPYAITNFNELMIENEAVYQYHSQLNATHPFTSPWYSWPLMLKPVWYYVQEFAGNMKETIVGIGNPAIWWVGILGLLHVLIEAVRTRKKEMWFILVAFLCMWLPYMAIGRVMFLYHYFPVLPFVMLAIVALFKHLTEKLNFKKSIPIYLVVVIIFFILFYPVATGLMVPSEFVDFLRWLPEWYF